MPFVSGSALPTARVELPRQASMYKKAPVPAGHPRNASYTSAENESLRRHVDPAYLAHRDNAFSTSTPMATPTHVSRKPSYLGQEANNSAMAYSNVQLPPGVTAEEVNRAFHLVAATASAMQSQNVAQSDRMHTPGLKRMVSHAPLHEREMSRAGNAVDAGADHGEGHGGHDAPNWSRFKSYSVLVGCTMLYAIIAGESHLFVIDASRLTFICRDSCRCRRCRAQWLGNSGKIPGHHALCASTKHD